MTKFSIKMRANKSLTFLLTFVLIATLLIGVIAISNALHDGSSEEIAYADVTVGTLSELQTALASAGENTTITLTDAITINSNITLDGKGATILGVGAPFVNAEDGTINQPGTKKVIFNITNSATVTLKNMILISGQSVAYSYDGLDAGAAVKIGSSCIVTAENVTITQSHRGVYIDGAKIVLKNCNFLNNVAKGGSAIAAKSSSTIIADNCSFSQNGSTNLSNGGTIWLDESKLYANNCVFYENTKYNGQGGAIGGTGDNSGAWIMNSTIVGNTVHATSTYSQYYSGGLNPRTNFYLVNSIATDNYNCYNTSATRNDISYNSSSGNSITMINSIYGQEQEASRATFTKENCKQDKTSNYAVRTKSNTVIVHDYSYGYNQIGKYLPSTNFSRSIAITTSDAVTRYYVPVSETGSAATGGIDTYFDYSDLTNIKMGYGESSSITGLGGLTAPTSAKKVIKYYEGSTRVSGVIGASATSPNLYNVKLASNISNGTVTGLTTSDTLYPSGTVLNLTATPNSGYVFVRWTVSGSSTTYTANPLAYTVSADATITPVFAVARTLSYDANGGTGSVPSPQVYANGTKVSAASSDGLSKEDHVFIKWNTNAQGTGTSYNPGAQITMNGNYTLFAIWKKQIVIDVESLISNIGTVTYTQESKDKIDEARAAYDALDDEDKPAVANYSTLTNAETKYSDLGIAEGVKDKINSIGDVEYTQECKDKIDDARSAYNALTNTQKGYVTNYSTLTAAESALNTLKTNLVNVVIQKINDIGEVEYTQECKALIDDARGAYEDLLESDRASVTNYEDLVEAEERYAEKKAIQDAADAVKAKIDAIGEVTYSSECKARIDDAKTSYDELTDKSKELVDNYSKLTDAEAKYSELGEVARVEELIESIGEVNISPESKGRIEEAREAYEKLTPEQKELIVEYYAKLMAAESKYEELIIDSQKHGFCVGWVVFIFMILEILATAVYVIVRYHLLDEIVKKCKLECLFEKVDLMTLIGLCVAGGMFLFALIALCCHQCAVTIISFIFTVIICGGFTYFFLNDKGIMDKLLKKQPKVEEKNEEVKDEPSDINN